MEHDQNNAVREKFRSLGYTRVALPVLYARITPVNSLRLLFNTYFGENLNLLQDVSYYSEYPEAYQFEIIPNQCQGKTE